MDATRFVDAIKEDFAREDIEVVTVEIKNEDKALLGILMRVVSIRMRPKPHRKGTKLTQGRTKSMIVCLIVGT